MILSRFSYPYSPSALCTGGGGGGICLRPWPVGGGGSPKGLVNGPVHNLLMQFFTLGSSKIQVFETYFSDTVITYNDHSSYVKHVLGRIYVFFALFGHCVGGGGGGSPKGLVNGPVHNLLM